MKGEVNGGRIVGHGDGRNRIHRGQVPLDHAAEHGKGPAVGRIVELGVVGRLKNHWLVPLSGPLLNASASVPRVFERTCSPATGALVESH